MSSGVPPYRGSYDQSSSNTTTNIKALFLPRCMKNVDSDVESEMSLKEMEEPNTRKWNTPLEKIGDTR